MQFTIKTVEEGRHVELRCSKLPDGTLVVDLPHVLDVPANAKISFMMPDTEGVIRDLTARYEAPGGRVFVGLRNVQHVFHLAHTKDDKSNRYWVNGTTLPVVETSSDYVVRLTYAECLTEDPMVKIIGPFVNEADAIIYTPPAFIEISGTRYHLIDSVAEVLEDQFIYATANSFNTLAASECISDGDIFVDTDVEILSALPASVVAYVTVTDEIVSTLGQTKIDGVLVDPTVNENSVGINAPLIDVVVSTML
jgi:hypothetical protein